MGLFGKIHKVKGGSSSVGGSSSKKHSSKGGVPAENVVIPSSAVSVASTKSHVRRKLSSMSSKSGDSTSSALLKKPEPHLFGRRRHGSDDTGSTTSTHGWASVRSIDEGTKKSQGTSVNHHQNHHQRQLLSAKSSPSMSMTSAASSFSTTDVDKQPYNRRPQGPASSFESSVLVGILTATASFSVLENASAGDDRDNLLNTLTILASGVSTICGLHATIVFASCSLYGHQQEYEPMSPSNSNTTTTSSTTTNFVSKILPQRIRGKNSLTLSVVLLALECALLLYTRIPQPYHAVGMVTAAACTAWMVHDWRAIVQAGEPVHHHHPSRNHHHHRRKNHHHHNPLPHFPSHNKRQLRKQRSAC